MKSLQLDELIVGSKEGPYVRLESHTIEAFDRNGIQRFRVLMEGGRYPTLELCDGNGNARIIATVVDNGSPFLTFRDGNFTARAEQRLNSSPRVAHDSPSCGCTPLRGSFLLGLPAGFQWGPEHLPTLPATSPGFQGNVCAPWELGSFEHEGARLMGAPRLKYDT